MPPDDRRPPSTPEERALFLDVMRALYGDDWLDPAAGALRIRDKRILARMANGDHHKPSGGPWPIPAGIWRELAELLEAERRRLETLASKARERGG